MSGLRTADPSARREADCTSRQGVDFSDVHADFTVHPHHRTWQRRANLLLYLNEDWKPEYGGDLGIQRSTT